MTDEAPGLFPEVNPAQVGNGRRFQRLFLPKFLRIAAHDLRLNGGAQDLAYQTLCKWADLETSGKLLKMKETALQGEFLGEVFGKALAYTLFSENLTKWQLQAAYSLPGGAADAAIGFFGVENGEPPRALIELKGPNVNVDRDRQRGRTAVGQCWDYLYAVPTCPWGIVCNYVSFRLYHRNKTQRAFELFTLQELRDRQRFNEFYYIFERGGLLPSFVGQRPRAEQLLDQTDNRQKEVGGKLYADYHEQRLALIDHLRRKPHNKTLDAAIKIAQKLLDRIIFIAFCEDRELLPAESIKSAWRNLQPFTQAVNPRWQNFRVLFRSIDKGNEQFNITRYNGGLFALDLEVDDLDLGDDWTNFFNEVSAYDFRDEVNVDVLGRLFEKSVSDLESLRTVAEPPPKKTASGRRKREGIYYTPRPITQYIVEHTIGTCLDERFGELADQFAVDPDEPPSAGKLANWIKLQEARLEVLRRLRVCDPACGSGAFLIEAFDYLEERYDEVINALCLHKGKDDIRLRDEISATILRQNLFGVDLSPEAVEITQLALWIRTAERGKTLEDLSQHIQCGNSIVDAPAVDPRAFDWPARFANVFAEGRFDCIISNPPYVKLQNFRKREPRIAEYLVQRYRSAQTGNFDMFLPFIERGLDLLKPGGRMGFIAPNLWLFNEYGRGLRDLLAERQALERFVDFKSHQVFEDATTYTALQFFATQPRTAIEVADAGSGALADLQFYPVPYSSLGTGAWALLDKREQHILDKMRKRSVTLAEASAQIFQGLITSADSIYHLTKLGPGRYFSKALNGEVEIEDRIMKPIISGEDAVPFATPHTNMYVLFPYRVKGNESRLLTGDELANRFKRCWEYLRKNEAALRARERRKFDDEQWWRFGRHQNIDKQLHAKILVPRLLLHLFACVDSSGSVCIDNVDVGGVLVEDGWDLHFLCAILNSKACDFAWRNTSKPFRGEYRSANKQFIAPLPIPKTQKQEPLANLARRLAELHGRRLAILQQVHRRFIVDLPPAQLIETSPLPPKLPGKLRSFDEVPMGQLINGLEEFAKRKFNVRERERWDEYLATQMRKMADLKNSIRDATDALNAHVYSLFALTEDEIKVVEETISH